MIVIGRFWKSKKRSEVLFFLFFGGGGGRSVNEQKGKIAGGR